MLEINTRITRKEPTFRTVICFCGAFAFTSNHYSGCGVEKLQGISMECACGFKSFGFDMEDLERNIRDGKTI